VQGLTLPIFIRRTHVFDSQLDGQSEATTRQQINHGLKENAFKFLKEKQESGFDGHGAVEKLLKKWEDKAKAADDSGMSAKTKEVFLELLESQRQYLSELNKDVKIDEEIIREQLYLIDLEEERLRMG
jgi:CPA1 family monovalent cation:H+ antiporter